MPPDTRHPCAGRTLAMARCFDAIATTGRPVGAGKTLAALLVHKLVRRCGFVHIQEGGRLVADAAYEPTDEARRQWDAWKATLSPPL